MAQVDFSRREIAVKLVYYGPAMSGKTTNLQRLHRRLSDAHRSRLVTLDTAHDRTLFFDLLPISLKARGGLKVLLKLFTVPGQVMHNHTRRLVLRGADGVAFVADSQISETRANNEAYAHLRANLRDNGMDPDVLPIVIQYNKRDLLPELIRSADELAEIARRGRAPIVEAVAITEVGVLETFFTLAGLVWDQLEQTLSLGSRHGFGKREFLRELGQRLQAQELAECYVGASSDAAESPERGAEQGAAEGEPEREMEREPEGEPERAMEREPEREADGMDRTPGPGDDGDGPLSGEAG